MLDQLPLAAPEGARALVLLVHPDVRDRCDSGQRFIADVLGANGWATLSLALLRADEHARGLALPDAPSLSVALQSLIERLADKPATRRWPLALVGVHEAAAVCAHAVSLGRLEALQSRVWLDGPVPMGVADVAGWTRPTLCLLGRHGVGGTPQPLRGVRRLPAPHRLVKLPQRSRPQPSAGVHEAMACELLAWLQRTLPAAPAAVRCEAMA